MKVSGDTYRPVDSNPTFRFRPVRPVRSAASFVRLRDAGGIIRRAAGPQPKESALTSRPSLRVIGCLLATLVSSQTDARSGNGFSVSRSQETAISTGMSLREVEEQLGRPARAVRYRNAPGPTWIYNVIDPLFGRTQFDIDVGPDERVLSTVERVIGGTSAR
jgi:hypothetical protein